MIYYIKSDIVPGLEYQIKGNINLTLTFSQWLYHLKRKQEVEGPPFFKNCKMLPDLSLFNNPFGTDENKTGVLKFVCGG